MVDVRTFGELFRACDKDLMGAIDKWELETKLPDAIYRELHRRYLRNAAQRVIVAAIITAAATILIQLLPLLTKWACL